MKTILIMLAIILIPFSTQAADPECYQLKFTPVNDGPPVLVIDTIKPMTHEKSLVAKSPQEVKKNCNKVGQEIYERLMVKEPDVRQVVISYRQIAIVLFPLGSDWTKMQPKIEATLNRVLCK
jgi:hypothetical protein